MLTEMYPIFLSEPYLSLLLATAPTPSSLLFLPLVSPSQSLLAFTFRTCFNMIMSLPAKQLLSSFFLLYSASSFPQLYLHLFLSRDYIDASSFCGGYNCAVSSIEED